jgi:uncharacterized protein YcfJ
LYRFSYLIVKPFIHFSATNEIFGGILGGAIGNQFGGGSGKKVMTVAGALLGASIANDNENYLSIIRVTC